MLCGPPHFHKTPREVREQYTHRDIQLLSLAAETGEGTEVFE